MWPFSDSRFLSRRISHSWCKPKVHSPHHNFSSVYYSCVLWGNKTCSTLKVNWTFGGTCHLHFQIWGTSQAREQHDVGIKRNLPSKHQLTFTGLHGIVSQKTELFINTAVRTSDPAKFVTSIHLVSQSTSISISFIVCFIAHRPSQNKILCICIIFTSTPSCYISGYCQAF
jgi:hypothetical protein